MVTPIEVRYPKDTAIRPYAIVLPGLLRSSEQSFFP